MVTIEPSTIHIFHMTIDCPSGEREGMVEVCMEDVMHFYDDQDSDVIYLRFKFVVEAILPANTFKSDGYMERTYRLYPHSGMTAYDLYSCVADGGKKIKEMLGALYGKENKMPAVVLEKFEEDFFPAVLQEIRDKQGL